MAPPTDNPISLRTGSINLAKRDFEGWRRNGYLILEGVFSDSEIEAFNCEIDRLWEEKAKDDNSLVVDFWEGDLFGKRIFLKDAPENSRKFSHKLNDVHMVSEVAKNICLNPKLVPVLKDLLEGDPMAIGTLTFEKGSQQPDHFDTYYMPPPVEGKMVVSSICLENVHPDSGPVRVFPSSHRIPPFIFSHGGIHIVDNNELNSAKKYIDSQLEKKQIEPIEFLGKSGDVLVWDGQLYHGGTPIRDSNRTRKSLVTHYWRSMDVESKRVIPYRSGCSILKRDHHKTWQ